LLDNTNPVKVFPLSEAIHVHFRFPDHNHYLLCG
jgi:hypothetical protein